MLAVRVAADNIQREDDLQHEDGPFVGNYEDQLGETCCVAEEAKEAEDEVDLEIDEDSDVPEEGLVNICETKN